MIAGEICEIEIGISERCLVESFDDRIRRFGTGPFDQCTSSFSATRNRRSGAPSGSKHSFHQLFAGAPRVISEDIIVIDDPVQRVGHVRSFEHADRARLQSNA